MLLREGIFFSAVSMSMILGCGIASNTSEGKQTNTGGTATGSFASGGTGGTSTGSSFASGGTGGAAQGQGSGQGSGGALAATGPDGFPAVCVNSRPLIPGEREPVAFSLKLELNGKPLIYGENNALAGGGTLLLSNLRFYISEVNLVDASNQRVPVDLVDSGGHRKPYNVQFVNAEAPESLGLRVRAPVGTYSGVEFLLGLTDGCNNTFLPLDPPLDEASQLKWPHTFGYLFLRYEGMVTEPLTIMPSTAQMVHMGGGIHERMAPKISVLGAITVAKANAEIPLKFALDEVLKGAAMPADLANFMLPPPAPPGPPGAEILAGEHLRQNVPKLTIFSLSGP